MHDKNIMQDAFKASLEMARKIEDKSGLVGFGTVAVVGPDGSIKDVEAFANLITTVGDEYYARRAAAGVGTPNLAQPTLVNGMKLGTGTTAAAKSGAGAVLVTYEAGSQKLFDTSHPSLVDEAGDTGWSVQYKCTWPAGTVTDPALTEAVICVDASVDEASTGAETIARVTFAAKNKTADDSLVITWNHKFLGA